MLMFFKLERQFGAFTVCSRTAFKNKINKDSATQIFPLQC